MITPKQLEVISQLDQNPESSSKAQLHSGLVQSDGKHTLLLDLMAPLVMSSAAAINY